MPSAGPRVIALEGPSNSGKSTLAAGIVRERAAGSTVVMPCYASLVPTTDLPPPRAATPDGQLAALAFFIELDRRRRGRFAGALREAELVIVDRCWVSLLAHTYAIAKTGGPCVYAAAREQMARSEVILQPEVVLYLDAGEEARAARTPKQDLGTWFNDPNLNAALDEFFEQEAPVLVESFHRLDARADADSVLRAAMTTLVREGILPDE